MSLLTVRRLPGCVESVMLGRRIECPIHGTSISVHRLAPDLAIGSVRFIEDSDLRKGNQIGQGGYGLVYKASWNNTPVALKLLIVKVEQASTPWVALCVIVRVRVCGVF